MLLTRMVVDRTCVQFAAEMVTEYVVVVAGVATGDALVGSSKPRAGLYA